MVVRLRGAAEQPDIQELRERVIQELKRFEQRLRAAGVHSQSSQNAHYALCATIDDIVLNTPWGQQSDWRKHPLTSVFHDDVDAGEGFFKKLEQLRSDPAGHDDVLNLMYLCLSLGFEGRLRGRADGAAESMRIRERLFNTIVREQGQFERELSPHWQGVRAAHKPLVSHVPIWVFALCSGAILMGIYLGFVVALANASNVAFAEVAGLPPQRDLQVRVKGGNALPELDNHTPRLRDLLADDIAQNRVKVDEDLRSIKISIPGSAPFTVGSANLDARYVPVLERIGTAIDGEPGQVKIVGHTDNTPIRTVRFPSNYELSLARAEAALEVIRARVKEADRVVAEGLGDSDPLVPNNTPQGKESNRRIEIVLQKQFAGSRDAGN
jgi:type VI secretion system protein ImpK